MSNFLKESFEKNNFNCTDIDDEILLVEDFLLKEELDQFWDIINTRPEEDWSIEYVKNLKRFCLEKFGRDDVDNLVAEGKFEITQNWNDKNLQITEYPVTSVIHQRVNSLVQKIDSSLELGGFGTMQRMQKKVQLKSHTDQHTDPSIRYATILYLNDDYVDGELFFENLDIQLKPKPGSLLVFPGTEKYEHGVRFVGDGPIRYVIVGFIREKDHYEKNRY
jgi:2OG-Fe(II) oxygenase superfamily